MGSRGFGTEFRYRSAANQLDGKTLDIDYAANAASLGAHAIRASSRSELVGAIREARRHAGGPVCVVVETDRDQRVPGYESWWDVPVAEVSESPTVQEARSRYEEAKRAQRYYL